MSLLHNLTVMRHQPPRDSAFMSPAPSQNFTPGSVTTHRLMSTAWRILRMWLRRRNDRAVLRSLSLRDIHDFCPRHTEAEAEMNKPFWRA